MLFTLVGSFRQALQVRALRNSCREDLTNLQERIGIARQVRWYFRFYRGAMRASSYRLYLLCDDQGSPVAYGALAREGEELSVTECVAGQHRGKGYGSLILDHLIRIATGEKRDLVAELWASNARSIAMHERSEFIFQSRRLKSGKELLRYMRPAAELGHA